VTTEQQARSWTAFPDSQLLTYDKEYRMGTYWLLGISISASAHYDTDHPWWLRILIWIIVFTPLIFVGERIDETRKAVRP
jgi:hypothetical protein